MVKNSREKMKVVECNRGKQWWLLVVVLLCFFSAVSVVQADEAAVFVDGMQDMDFLPMVDADLLAQESDPNYVSSDDDDLFLAEAAQELDGSVNTITEIAAAAGTQFHTHEGASEQLYQKLPEMVKVSALPMTDFEQKIVSHEIDEKKLHLTALSEKLESEIKQNTVLQDELETCQSTVQACEEKMREIDSLVHTIPDCSPEIEAKYQSQIQAFETEINALKHDLSVEVEKSRYIERNSQQVDIKLKLTKNELNVAKIALEQQRLAMDSTVLQYEDKFSILQKEIDRLNMLLAENRRAVKDMKHELSAAKDSKPTGFWSSFLSSDSGAMKKEESGAESQPSAAGDQSTATEDSSKAHRTIDQTTDKVKTSVDKVTGEDESIVKMAIRQVQKIVPFAISTIAWEYKWAYFAVSGSWRLVNHLWNEYLQPFLSFSSETLRLNVVKSKAVEIYDAHLKPTVDSYKKLFDEKHRERVEDFYEHYLEPVVDFVVDKTNYFLYFTAMVLQGEESPWGILQGLMSRIQDLVQYIAGQSKVQSIFGSFSDKIVGISLYSMITLASYYLRHPIAGLAMLILVVAILPFLLVVWALLKVFGLFYDRKTARGGAKKSKRDPQPRKKTRASSEEIKDSSEAEPVEIRPASNRA